MNRLKDLRTQNDYSVSQLAEILGCSKRKYLDYEFEKSKIPLRCIIKLAFLYDTSIDYIANLTDDPIAHQRKKQ